MQISQFLRVASSTLTWLLVAQISATPVTALCNLSATLECCELVMPANDPVSALVLSLADIQGLILPITPIGIACTPFTTSSPTCKTNLVGCDDKPHPSIGVGCGLNLQIST
ncbi:hypothetical protein QCA50_018246 [Cerrena zonata]|uniref:Hydrophobin n=1 Tax=Cerrena zonata TaxID=2478898 RepID=A0AAW0FHY2_9APHY